MSLGGKTTMPFTDSSLIHTIIKCGPWDKNQ